MSKNTITKEYLAKQFQNFANKVSSVFARKTELTQHTNDTTIHVTETDKTNWNDKSKVVPNPTLSGSESALNSLQIGDDKFKIEGGEGTTVIANPTVAETDTPLTSIQIGDDKYRVVGGSGGASSASDVSYTPNDYISKTNVQDAIDIMLGIDKSLAHTYNVSYTSDNGYFNITCEQLEINDSYHFNSAKNYECFRTFGYMNSPICKLTKSCKVNGVVMSEGAEPINAYSKSPVVIEYVAEEPNPIFTFYEDGKGLSTNDYTTTEKEKLANLSNYDDTEIRGLISNKVDKVEGKGLSDNNYTTAEKEKLADTVTSRPYEQATIESPNYLKSYIIVSNLPTTNISKSAFYVKDNSLYINPTGNNDNWIQISGGSTSVLNTHSAKEGHYSTTFELVNNLSNEEDL